MDPIAGIGSALGSINAAISLVRVAVGAKMDAEVRAKVLEAMDALIQSQTQLLDARIQMHDLVDENRTLKRKLEEREDWKQRADRYELVKAPGGAMVHQFKGEPAHYACPACFERQQVQVLQDRRVMSGDWSCPSCDKTFHVTQPTKNPSRGPGGGPNSWMAS